jgi:hypothetical protein
VTGNTKGLRVKTLDEAKGQVTAVFATFDTVDSDGDVTLPGAATDGAAVRISAYNHTSWGGALPVGKGTIQQTASEIILDGQFFMDLPRAAETFQLVKAMGDLQEWSYGYNPTKYSYGEFGDPPKRVRFLEQLDIFEVSPVLLGAGVNTRTLAAKSGGLTFSGEAEAVLTALTALADRAADVMAMRREKGKGLGDDSAVLLGRIDAQLKRLDALLHSGPDTTSDDIAREYLRFVHLTRNARG